MSTTPLPKTLRILVAQGVNLDLLGSREPEIYGHDTLASIETLLRDRASALAEVFDLSQPRLEFFQTNHEGEFLDRLGSGWDGALINAGAWTHTSLALADRLIALRLPFVEVHLSNLARREAFRHHSYSAPHALGVCYGFGAASYLSGLCGLFSHLKKIKPS